MRLVLSLEAVVGDFSGVMGLGEGPGRNDIQNSPVLSLNTKRNKTKATSTELTSYQAQL